MWYTSPRATWSGVKTALYCAAVITSFGCVCAVMRCWPTQSPSCTSFKRVRSVHPARCLPALKKVCRLSCLSFRGDSVRILGSYDEVMRFFRLCRCLGYGVTDIDLFLSDSYRVACVGTLQRGAAFRMPSFSFKRNPFMQESA